jgi:hypothetical protein
MQSTLPQWKIPTLIVLTSISLCSFVNIDPALSEGVETTGQATSIVSPTATSTDQSTVTIPVGSPSTSVLSLPQSGLSVQQSGLNNLTNIGTTTSPNCGGFCLYGNIKSGSSTSNNFNSLSGSQFEGSLGFMWQITSPDQTNLETQRRLAESQIGKTEDELKFSWMKALTAAINTGNIADANGIAILLAPKLGKTPRQLLNEVMQINSNVYIFR